MDSLSSSPFVVFTFIAAPAVLTNAASVMSLTTSNRLARAVDRSRAILATLAASPAVAEPERALKARQVELLRRRALLLTRALAWYQLAIGAFALATLVALVGTVLHLVWAALGLWALYASLGCAVIGVSSIAAGAWGVIGETRLGYSLLLEDTAEVMQSLRSPLLAPGEVRKE